MPICPRCNKYIEKLSYSARRQIFQEFFIDDRDKPFYNDAEFGDDDNPDYYCPECDTSISKNQDKAVKFLKKCDNCKKDFDKKINLKINGEEYYFCFEKCKDNFKIKKMAEEL